MPGDPLSVTTSGGPAPVSRETGPDAPVGRSAGEEPVAPSEEPLLPAWLEPRRTALQAYAGILRTAGVERGLLGPREVPRLWERHLLNCLVVADPAEGLVPEGGTVLDIGSGAGLPGLSWALARPDLQVILVEPLLRRATFLAEVVASLPGTDRVEVRRARAEELVGRARAGVVTARAVAPLARLVGWAVPLTQDGGVILALKGASAEREIRRDQAALDRLGIATAEVLHCGAGVVDPPTTVVRLVPAPVSRTARGTRAGRAGSASRDGRRQTRHVPPRPPSSPR